MGDRLSRFFDGCVKYSGAARKTSQYSELAEIYDQIMDHVNYVSWANYISSIFGRFQIKVTDILELACGTGNLSIELRKLGYRITGMDISPPMLSIAARKFKERHIPLKLFSSTMTSIPLKYEFDVVLSIYDSINYITNSEDFVRVLDEVWAVTRPGGFFIFDVCTVRNSELFFSHNTMIEHFGEIECERKCTFTKADSIQKNKFIIRKNGKEYRENHCQKIYTIQQIRSMIENTPFSERGVYDDMSFIPGTEMSERVHFVLQKTAS